ncbi:hypothetical protein [Hymenobacter profundi]|uniref:Uncharacterized protein n=1 Tax=Hymenobacter profundi TaxID=1982110 RepID=A0ABS6WYS1_9BACT|nr:hypothetical protein [Hymenobacter profundi]MBW3128748.1 hypothetical protein [Hymenobacter profundi]
MQTKKIDYKQINGWGVDADPENDPTYPMQHREDAPPRDIFYDRPPQQPIDVEVLHSIERPDVTAVFGATLPPKGLSGVIRRFAFKYSENQYKHWLPLIFADRVDVVEGVLKDLAHGHVPNIFAEKGYPMEWKYNRTAFVTKMATIAAITVGTVVFLNSGKDKKKSKHVRGYRGK